MLLEAAWVLLVFFVRISPIQCQYGIVYYRNENNGADGYDFSYETEDGTLRSESGRFINGIWTVTGSSTWRDPFGKAYTVTYTADDQGYRAYQQSDAFPSPLPPYAYTPQGIPVKSGAPGGGFGGGYGGGGGTGYAAPAAGYAPPAVGYGSKESFAGRKGYSPLAKNRIRKISMTKQGNANFL